MMQPLTFCAKLIQAALDPVFLHTGAELCNASPGNQGATWWTNSGKTAASIAITTISLEPQSPPSARRLHFSAGRFPQIVAKHTVFSNTVKLPGSTAGDTARVAAQRYASCYHMCVLGWVSAAECCSRVLRALTRGAHREKKKSGTLSICVIIDARPHSRTRRRPLRLWHTHTYTHLVPSLETFIWIFQRRLLARSSGLMNYPDGESVSASRTRFQTVLRVDKCSRLLCSGTWCATRPGRCTSPSSPCWWDP